MTPPKDRPLYLPLLAIVATTLLPSPVRADEAEAWETLGRVRAHLEEAGPREMGFVQTFVPAGFQSGEKETGRVALGLPRCVRWDYEDPYPKSFLLCGTELHAWNPGEPVGQYYGLERDQPGLDLLRLDRERLERTYDAQLTRSKEALVLELEPRREATGALAGATLRIAPDERHVLALSYVDAEGSRTEFVFDDPRSVSAQGRFEPPSGLRWERGTR